MAGITRVVTTDPPRNLPDNAARSAGRLWPGRRLRLRHRLLQDEDFLTRANQFETLPDLELLLRFVLAQPLDALAAKLDFTSQIGVLFFERADLALLLN